jgi:hypothetical protein
MRSIMSELKNDLQRSQEALKELDSKKGAQVGSVPTDTLEEAVLEPTSMKFTQHYLSNTGDRIGPYDE